MEPIEVLKDVKKHVEKHINLIKTFGFDNYAQKHVDKLKKFVSNKYEVKHTTDRTGSELWTIDDKLHRIDGPAIIDSEGNKYWFLNGKRHRVSGPAIEYAEGSKEWWLNGIAIKPEETIGNEYMEKKYPELIKSMIANQVHEK